MLPRRSLAAVLWASALRLFLRHIGVFCCLCVATAGAETLGAEQGSRRVVVLGSHKNPAIIENLRAELAMQGLTLLDQTTSERPIGLEDVARSAQAAAVVRLPEDGETAEIYLQSPFAETHPGKITVPLDLTEPDVAATRIAEALRARLARIDLSPPPPRRSGRFSATESKRAVVQDIDRQDAASFWVVLGPCATLSAGSAGAILHGRVELTYELQSDYAVGAIGLLPVAGGGVTATQGRATLQPWLAGPVVDARLWGNGRWSLWSGAGAGVLVVHMRGEAEQPYVGTADTVTSAAVLGRAFGRWQLTPRWHFRVGVVAGLASPRPVVQFAGTQVGSWGAPLAALSLGIASAP